MPYKFECLPGCSNCCQVNDGFVFLSEDEAEKIAKYLETTIAEMHKWFIKQIDKRLCLVDGENEHCIFIEDNRCLIYPVRPQQCRDYPFWPEIISSKERWEKEKVVCPGIGTGKIYKADEIEKIISKK